MRHLEIDKKYVTRDGRETIIKHIKDGIATTHWGSKVWADTGEVIRGKRSDGDIVSEVTEGPIRTVTRREIVPGVYGRVEVIEHDMVYGVHIGLVHKNCYMTAEELREAAHLFNQIAEVLED